MKLNPKLRGWHWVTLDNSIKGTITNGSGDCYIQTFISSDGTLGAIKVTSSRLSSYTTGQNTTISFQTSLRPKHTFNNGGWFFHDFSNNNALNITATIDNTLNTSGVYSFNFYNNTTGTNGRIWGGLLVFPLD